MVNHDSGITPPIKLSIDIFGKLLSNYNSDYQLKHDIFNEFAKVPEATPQTIAKVMRIAASKSLSDIKIVYDHFHTYIRPIKANIIKCMIEASTERDDIESLDYLFDLAGTKPNPHHQTLNPRDLIPNLRSCSASILSHFIDKGYINVDTNTRELIDLVDWACEQIRLDIIKVVHQRCLTQTQIRRYLPKVGSINKAAECNHYKSLSYLFEGNELG
ncbi:hypothetical protein SAMD00019534_101060 [Acytostelium subglobosum LB1]|uniref:hypothetical protein n=1 Tax=Acytostelium subglobosum LB1 TaxID=1410327 RepID=UPI000644D478|nr:hypothetical protein SAMD00019534_101060 [Acytostelium subglobosum LB1]GAM26931.1 hypothetical protein SAMD00019534_101060 [Acytostelium subglobosum LB1]|eukprot:XP_012750199.1 hypothetical protein SAMD00019534_101060 [Acytostelium subglobosum LB1]